MAKKCPPGVICIENMTIMFLFLFVVLIIVVGFYLFDKREYNKKKQNSEYETQNDIFQDREKKHKNENYNIRHSLNYQRGPLFSRPQTLMTNEPNNIFLNPYAPPLKQNRFYHMMTHDVRGDKQQMYNDHPHNRYNDNSYIVPINIPTSHYDLEYKQVGILTREDGKETILPIFGRPVHSNRNKWQYYTMTDKNNFIKLPVSHKGRSCTDDYGCDEIFSGDVIYVEGYRDAFKVTIYENNKPRYIPHL